MKRPWTLLIALVAVVLLLFFTSGGFLVVNNPQSADVIVVLAGETDRRPALGLDLLSKGLAPRMLLDVSADAKVYGQSLIDISQQYLRGSPQWQSASVCPIHGLSTRDEARDAAQCVHRLGARRVLVVTSDYHTRRSLSTFEHELSGCQISVAAAGDPQQFGSSWWRHRQWAKLNFDEWLRLVWWEAVDRWR